MILQGVAQRTAPGTAISPHLLELERFPRLEGAHAIQARIYCENPSANFVPSPGLLQHVSFPSFEWLRVDTWIETGTVVSPFFDPLVAKVIVTGNNRDEAVQRLTQVLAETKVLGPPNNLEYLEAICRSETFKLGTASTTFLDSFQFIPR